LISMTNSGPNGAQLNTLLEKWALEHFAGLNDIEPEQLALGDEALAQYVGSYETIAASCAIRAEGGRLLAKVEIKPEMLAVLRESGEDVDEEQPPIALAILAGDGDQYVVPDGPAKGMRGYFSRDADGHVNGVHLGGRLATKVKDTVPA